MSQLSASPAVSQLSGAGAAQAASSAIGAEAGGELEGVQGPSFGAVLSKQLKGIAALLEGREAPGLPGALTDKDGFGESAGNDAALAIIQIDFSALSALASPQVSDLPQASDLAQDSSVVPQDPALLAALPLPPALALSLASSAGPGSGGRVGSLSDEIGTERPTLDTRPAGEARLAAEIAGNGKNLPQMLTPEEPFAHKLAAFVDSAADKAGQQVQLADLSAAARPVVGMVDAATALRQPEQLPALPVAPRVGSAEWGGAVGEKVLWMANQNHQVAELHLNPPNLGPLEVRLTINNDQATAVFVSHHSAVRDAIETALPRLREMLADNGIMLGNASVGSESFGQQQQAFEQRGGGREGGHGAGGMDGIMGQVVGNAVPAGLARDGMVDIFA